MASATHKRSRLAPEQIKSILDYDPERGDLIWKRRSPDSFRCVTSERARIASRWNKLRAGKIAGTINTAGYRVLCIEKKTYQAHRVAFAIMCGQWPEGQIDHVNHVRDDNRWDNLREVSASENSRNRSTPKTNSCGGVGVHFHKPSGKYHARIWDGEKRIHLGAFDSAFEAISARNEASGALGYHENHGA